MASFNLPAMVKRTGRRKDVTLRPIVPSASQSTDLATIYAPAWQIWQQNIDRILAGYDPAPLPTADALTLDTADQVQAAINSVANEFLTILTARITPALQRWVVQAERVHRSKWAAAVRAGVGVDLDMMLSAGEVQETLSTFMARNVALCRNVSDQAQGRISDAVFRGYERRAPVTEVAKEIREATGMGRTRSIGIAADQSSKLSAALDRERRADAGLSQYKYRHSGKVHPRSWHKARDGFIYDSRTGKSVNGGPDIAADDQAGMAPWCGCREQAYIPLLDDVD